MVKDIEKLINKVKGYPNHIMVLADISGYSISYVSKIMNGKRKIPMDFVNHLLTISTLMDKNKAKIEKRIKETIENGNEI